MTAPRTVKIVTEDEEALVRINRLSAIFKSSRAEIFRFALWLGLDIFESETPNMPNLEGEFKWR